MKKIISLILCIVIVISLCGCGDSNKHKNYTEVEKFFYNEDYGVLFNDFTKVKVVDANSVISAASDAGKALGLKNATNGLTLKSQDTLDGINYYRLQQNYNGIEVVGNNIVIVTDQNGSVLACSSNLKDITEKDIKFTDSSAQQIIERIATYLNVSMSSLRIQSSHRVIKYQESPCLYYNIWVSYDLNDKTYLVNLYVPAGEGAILSGIKPDPYNIEDISVIDKFTSIAHDTGNYANQYMYDFGNGVFCFDAKGTKHYSDKNEMFEKAFAVGIERVDTSLQKYSNVNDFSSGVTKIKKWYSDKIEDADFDVAIVFDTGGRTSAGSVPSDVIKKIYLAQLNYTDREIAAIFINNSEDVSFEILAHEYTHLITNKTVNWSQENFLLENPAQCINEAYSDLFGMIIDWEINQKPQNKPFKWVSHRTDIANTQYPHKIGSKSFEVYKTDDGADCLCTSVGGELVAYRYAYCVTLQYAAYLMNTAQQDSLTIDEIRKLWLHTMYSLPSNCEFNTFRDLMMVTARFTGFSNQKVMCINNAFKTIGIDGTVEYSVLVNGSNDSKNNNGLDNSTPNDKLEEDKNVNGIKISTAADLKKIENNPGGSYILTNDIDLSSETSWKPLCSSSEPFTGTLDGNGYCIKNLKVNTTYKKDVMDSEYSGLFTEVSGANFKNLGIVDSEICVNSDEYKGAAGTLAGKSTTRVENQSYVLTKVTNCYVGKTTMVKSKVIQNGGSSFGATMTIGGFFGCGIANFTDCYNFGTIYADTPYADQIVGGFIGEPHTYKSYNCTIESCVSAAKIEARHIWGDKKGAFFGYSLAKCENVDIIDSYYVVDSEDWHHVKAVADTDDNLFTSVTKHKFEDVGELLENFQKSR